MKSKELKKLKKARQRAINQLLDSTNTKEQYIAARSDYYKVTREIFILKKKLKGAAVAG